MHPSDVLPMVQPSTASTVVFVLIVLAVVVAFVVGVRISGVQRGDGPAQVRSDTLKAALLAWAYLGLTAAVAGSGVLASDATPPPLMLFLGATNVVAVALAFSKLGGRLSRGVPLAALIGVQAFRLPLELVLHRWFQEGVVPVQMTYEGDNFDIVSGALAVVVGIWAWKGKPQTTVLWAYNALGLGLLLRVASIAVLSSPVPFRQYTEGPAVQLALHVPYVWIVPFCVSGALLGHLLVFRALWSRRRATGS